MSPRSCLGLRIHFRIRRSAAALLAVLVALALSSPAFCDELHDAARTGDLAKVKALVAEHPDLVSSKDRYGMTPLYYAAFNGRKDIAELLLANHAEVNAKDINDMTPLHGAAQSGHKDVVAVLLANHADVNAKDQFGYTPLHVAAQKGHKDVVELLLANKADVNARSSNGATPLHDAAENGHKDVAEVLLANHADVRAKRNWGNTPLHMAGYSNTKEVAELLLANHADVNARNELGYTPLHEAAYQGKKELAELLLANKADVNSKNNRGSTPLHLAARGCYADLVELLRQQGGQESASNAGGKSGQSNEASVTLHSVDAQPPAPAPEAVITIRVKRWQQDYDHEGYLNSQAQPQLTIFGQGMSVFMLKRGNNNDFIASLDIPAADGKTSTMGVLIQARNQDPTSGRQFTDIFLSGLVWTPRASAIGKLDLTGACPITTSPDFAFDAFRDSAAVIPFANGYAVNLFGQKLDERGMVDVHTDHKKNYVSDDGRPLYGRLVRSHFGKLEEIIFAPTAELPRQLGGPDE